MKEEKAQIPPKLCSRFLSCLYNNAAQTYESNQEE